jgi:adenylate cyclase, class 2
VKEIELKFLNINVPSIKKKLDEIGAELKYDAMTESYLFEKEGFDCWDSSKEFLRVRKIGDDFTINYKSPSRDSKMDHREEIEIKVDDYEQAILLIEKLGFKIAYILKKHRIHYEFGDISFELDTINGIPTYLEIEVGSEDDMVGICERLGLDIGEGRKGSVVEVMRKSA